MFNESRILLTFFACFRKWGLTVAAWGWLGWVVCSPTVAQPADRKPVEPPAVEDLFGPKTPDPSCPEVMLQTQDGYLVCTINPILQPGVIALIPRADVKEAAFDRILRDYGLKNTGVMSLSEWQHDGRTEKIITYHVEVSTGREESWVKALSTHRSIRAAFRLPVKTASVNADGIYAWAMKENNSTRATTQGGQILSSKKRPLSVSGALGGSEKFLKNRYKGRGVYILTKSQPSRIEASISNMRGEILQPLKYWENLKIDLLMIPSESGIQIYIFADGTFAPGIGEKPPSQAAFKDMTQPYHQALSDYVNALMVQVQQNLAVSTNAGESP